MSIEIRPIELARRESVAREITRHLIAVLGSGHYSPGTRLPSERQWADQLGISRGAVRQAIKSLDLLGMVEVRPGDGTYLKTTEAELLPDVIEWGLMLRQPQVMDLVEARAYVEPIVARLAAQRRDAKGLAELGEIVNALHGDDGNVAQYVEHDVAFHMKIAELAGNAVFVDVLSSIRTLLRVWIRRVVIAAGGTGDSFEEHARVFAMVEKGDGEGAAAMMTLHLASASAQLLGPLETQESASVARVVGPSEPTADTISVAAAARATAKTDLADGGCRGQRH
ncbi:MAG TPA: FadR/GntR family transcriptional regulator [Candidatus Acidoferrales bacterium]|nr:FadR/GntR family transcriptional regulator [Candidatus Acidoferrales bacterium]